MTINIKNFLNDKTKLSKMGEFQNLKQIEGARNVSSYQLTYMEMEEMIYLYFILAKVQIMQQLTTTNSITSEFIPWNNNSHKKIIKGLIGKYKKC